LYWALHITALSFETFFFLSLINRRFRTFFVSSALAFHAFVYFFLSIPSTTMLVIYLIFVDWQALYTRWVPFKNRSLRLKPIPTSWLIGLSAGLVVAGILIWSSFNPIAYVQGRIFNRTVIWAFCGVVGIFFSIKSGLAILRLDVLPLLTRIRKRSVRRAEQHS
jgi:hypothetical protein